MVHKIASKIRDTRPGASVTSIITLQTEKSHRENIWHTNMLLSATEDEVIVHDPTDQLQGAAERPLDREDFYKRWAVALNRAHLIIAA